MAISILEEENIKSLHPEYYCDKIILLFSIAHYQVIVFYLFDS